MASQTRAAALAQAKLKPHAVALLGLVPALPARAADSALAASNLTFAVALLALLAFVLAAAMWTTGRRRLRAASAENAALRERLGQADALLAASPDGHFLWSGQAGSCSEALAAALGIEAASVREFSDLAPCFEGDSFIRLQESVETWRGTGEALRTNIGSPDGARSFEAIGIELGWGVGRYIFVR